jgi:hypothetical protein
MANPLMVWLKLVPALLLLVPPPVSQNPKRLEKVEEEVQHLQEKYDKEKSKDAVHQAKALAKLLPKVVEAAGLRIQAGQVDQAIESLTQCRDEAERVYKALLATGRNPVKKSDGFTQLQIALRESVRGLSEVLFVVPYQRREPVEAVRADMEQLNARLLQELFPPPAPKTKKSRHEHQ